MSKFAGPEIQGIFLVMIRNFIVLFLLSFFPVTNTLAQTTCVDTVPIGDGWGWDGSQSCRVGSSSNSDTDNNSSSMCVDTNPVGDGWGWDGSQSCRVGSSSNSDTDNNSSSMCVDTDPVGDGWGWDGSQSCRVGSCSNSDTDNNSSSACVDTDPVGDGWGWDGSSSCRVSVVTEETPSQTGALPDSFLSSFTGYSDTDGDRIDDRYDIDFNGGTDKNGNGVDDIYEYAIRGRSDTNNDGIEDIAHIGLVLSDGISTLVQPDGPDTSNVDSLFINAWGAADIVDQNCDGGHAGFGSHIIETYDRRINSVVFKFVSHAMEDKDCAIVDTDDRQRLQVSNSGRNPDVLASSENEWMTYRFRFLIPETFSVNTGLTTFFQLRHFVSGNSNFEISAREVWSPDLRRNIPSLVMHYHIPGTRERTILLTDSFERYKSRWIDAFVRTRSSNTNGVLQVILRDHNSGDVIAEVFRDDLDMWVEEGAGQKSSYGIYRLFGGGTPLKDEEFFIHTICLAKGSGKCLK